MEERIRNKAYQLYLESGKKENRDIENWNNAKNIISFNNDLSLEEFKELLSFGIDFNYFDKCGYKLLHYTVNPEKVKLLIDAGANPNVKTRCGDTPLHCSHSIETTKLLLEAGANPNLQNIFGKTILGYPISYEKTKLLLEYGADPNIQDHVGYTALTSRLTLEEIKLFIDYGADLNIQSKYGTSPLWYLFDIYKYKPCNKKKYYLQGLLKILLEREIKNMNAICSFQNIYRNRLMNPNHPFCKRKLEEEFNNFQNSCSN